MGLAGWLFNRSALYGRAPDVGVRRPVWGELLAAELEIFDAIRRQRSERRATDIAEILRRYPALGARTGPARILHEAAVLLARSPDLDDFIALLDASITIEQARASLPSTDRRMCTSIRQGALALRSGSSPVDAMRAGRRELPSEERLATGRIALIADLPL